MKEWVCAPLTCPDCVCGVCCALDLCGTDCHHVQQGEQAQTGSQQQARTTMPTSFRVPTPKTSSRYSQQALLEEVRVHTQSTLEQIAAAASGKFLDLELGIECPDGEVTVIKAMARFDTGSNLDVIDPRVATVLKT